MENQNELASVFNVNLFLWVFIQHELKHNVEELLDFEIYFITNSEKERIILFSRKEKLQNWNTMKLDARVNKLVGQY